MDLASSITLMAFAAAFLAVFGVNMALADVFERHRKSRLQQLEEELAMREKLRAKESVRSLKKTSLGELAEEAFREQESQSLLERCMDALGQTGMRLSVPQLVAYSLLIGAVSGTIAYLATNSLIIGLVASLMLATLPALYVAYRRAQRLEKLLSQLPDAMELMSRVLRAGQTITQAMYAVSQEFKSPIGPEFGYCYEQQNLGLPQEVALRDLAKRTGLLEIRIFVLAMLVHRQTGGNLTELLDKLADIIRERYRIRGKIKALTAEGRMQAAILLALPPFMFVVLLFLARGYALQLLDHPKLIAASLGGMVVGAAWIHRIVNFDF